MSSDKTALGDRMKSYENIWRQKLPRRSYVLIRLDGKAFHTYTRLFEKPFASEFHDALCAATVRLCSEMQNAKFGYAQSDEVSILLTDWDNLNTEAWFDNNIQKLVSVSASIFTAAFNKEIESRYEILQLPLAVFDARVFTLPQQSEVYNYFIWRQQDCIRNSISTLAQQHFSPKQLHGRRGNDMLKMLDLKEIDYFSYPSSYRNGSTITYLRSDNPDGKDAGWGVNPAPVWRVHETSLINLIPLPTIYEGYSNDSA